MFAVINIKGNQLIVTPEKEYNIDLVESEISKKKEIEFSDVLLVSDGEKVLVGQPTLLGATVKAEIVSEVLEPKTHVLKFQSKKRYQRTASQRTKKTRIKILQINVKDKK